MSDAPGVLIVDDEPAIRQILKLVCDRVGLRTFAANDGHEAISLYESRHGEIHLVLLDVNMPTMDGPTTLQRLRQIAPNVRACFMSGWTGRYTLADLKAHGADYFFEKPFRVDQLGEDLLQLITQSRVAA